MWTFILAVLCAGCRLGFDTRSLRADASSDAARANDALDSGASSGTPTFVSLGMQISSGNSNAFVDVSAPPGIQAGDLLIAAVGPENNTTVTAAGWTAVANNLPEVVLYKVATGSEPPSYTFNTGQPMYLSAGVMRFAGADMVTPIDSGTGAPTSSATRTAPELTTSNPNELLVGCWGNRLGGAMTPPAPMVLVLDAHASLTAAMCATELRSMPGATGPRTSAGGGGGGYAAVLLAIVP